MKLSKAQFPGLFLFFLLAIVPAFAQRATIGVDAGEASDKFGGLARFTGPAFDVNAQLIVLQGNAKESGPNVVAGGDIRFPIDTSNHANEFAIYGGVAFPFGKAFSAGFHVQIRKIYVPPSTIDGQTFNRNNMELLELPLIAEYKFGPSRHAFVQAQVAPELTPRFRASYAGYSSLPNPSLDHGYDLRGSIGYTFGQWYAKGTYETRYFKFTQNAGNPNGLNNWRSDFASAGIGFIF
jgi:hypothetical protein